ncbi:PREDICTED: filamin-A-like [Amphimedon queenslandica]|uniref:Calponin-homology (CH) domain-containing protein n=1 Tax=Amphimedon queenslandica TaxID=400682 RepID=A0AAN0IGS1_AMPQE|nr:PREDICTED: filamin-A-like [Amphimedon queenslandica]|eukprot:XP_003388797.1 PREDICTED: filamin-A-like [Amphimedon queenslandica]
MAAKNKDAQILKKVFTNWFNDRLRGNLKVAKHSVNDLQHDLTDGLLLILLLENLAKPRKVGKYNKKPVSKIQCMENLSLVFKFIKAENIKLVNIGPEDIYGCNLKLILGLIWTLIGHFQIRSSGRGLSTKQAMKEWLHTQIPDYNIQNFTTDWNDGRAVCGLVDRLKPGLCPNHASLSPKNGLENCQLGMTLAEDNFEIPKILDPEDLNNPDVDDLSVMTYVSYFFVPASEILLSWIQAIIPQQGITNLSTDWNNGINLAALMEACHPGLIPSWKDLDPHKAKDNLDTCIKLARSRLDIVCPVGPDELSDPKVDEIIVATYLSRFKYSKLQTAADELTMGEPDFTETGVGVLKEQIEIPIDLGASPELVIGQLALKAAGPTAEAVVTLEGTHKAKAKFIPLEAGPYTVSCHLNDEEINKSPLQVIVIDPSEWTMTEDPPQYLHVNKPHEIVVKGRAYGSSPFIDVDVTNPDGFPSASVTDSILIEDPDTAAITLLPTATGRTDVSITVAGKDIKKTPFTVFVCDPDKCKVSGIDGVVLTGKPVSFSVYASDVKPEARVTLPNGDTKILEEGKRKGDDVGEEGKGGEEEEKGEGERKGYKSEREGDHAEEEGEEDGIGYTNVDDAEDEDSSSRTGEERNEGDEGIDGEEGIDDERKEMKDLGNGSDRSDDERADIEEIIIEDGEGLESDVGAKKRMKKKERPFQGNRGKNKEKKKGEKRAKKFDNKYRVTFVPTDSGEHALEVLMGGAPVPGNPFTVPVLDTAEWKVITDVPKHLQLGKKLDIELKGPSIGNPEVEFSISNALGDDDDDDDVIAAKTVKQNKAGAYTLTVTPLKLGQVKGQINVAEREVSAFDLVIVDPTKVTMVDWDDSESFVNEPITFTLNATGAGDEKPLVTAKGPILEYSPEARDNRDGTYTFSFTPTEPGPIEVVTTLAGFITPGSPFHKPIATIADPNLCSAKGPGLEKAMTGRPARFGIITPETGLLAKRSDSLTVDIVSADKTLRVESKIEDLNNKTYGVTYTVPVEGEYLITVKFYGKPIPGCDFKVTAFPAPDASKCRVYGPAMHPNALHFRGRPLELFVDTKNAGYGELQAVVQGPKKTSPKIFIADDNDGIYSLKIETKLSGWHRINIWWGQVHIPLSPIDIKVRTEPDYTKVRAYGPGLSPQIEARKEAEFFIETDDAGIGTLTVVLHGVKDAFKVDVAPIDPDAPRRLKGTYFPREGGDYEVTIKWDDFDVPGSPFKVHVIDHEEERRREMEERELKKELEREKKEKERKKKLMKRSSSQQLMIMAGMGAPPVSQQGLPGAGPTQVISPTYMTGSGGPKALKRSSSNPTLLGMMGEEAGATTKRTVQHIHQRRQLVKRDSSFILDDEASQKAAGRRVGPGGRMLKKGETLAVMSAAEFSKKDETKKKGMLQRARTALSFKDTSNDSFLDKDFRKEEPKKKGGLLKRATDMSLKDVPDARTLDTDFSREVTKKKRGKLLRARTDMSVKDIPDIPELDKSSSSTPSSMRSFAKPGFLSQPPKFDDKQKPKKKLQKSMTSTSIEAAMARNAGMLGDETPIGKKMAADWSKLYKISEDDGPAATAATPPRQKEKKVVFTGDEGQGGTKKAGAKAGGFYSFEGEDGIPTELPVKYSPVYVATGEMPLLEEDEGKKKRKKKSKRI